MFVKKTISGASAALNEISGHTKHGKEFYQSVRDPNIGYEFLRRSRGGDVRRIVNGDIAYVCGECIFAQKRLRNERAANIPSLRQIGFDDNGRFTSDPDEHPHVYELGATRLLGRLSQNTQKTNNDYLNRL
uniref:Uncharacterized protein n=1 Tax=Panagrolaimus davidi TaxID=227884 RepID=A0A914PQE3_9BILA